MASGQTANVANDSVGATVFQSSSVADVFPWRCQVEHVPRPLRGCAIALEQFPVLSYAIQWGPQRG